jgi:hypothetical protein
MMTHVLPVRVGCLRSFAIGVATICVDATTAFARGSGGHCGRGCDRFIYFMFGIGVVALPIATVICAFVAWNYPTIKPDGLSRLSYWALAVAGVGAFAALLFLFPTFTIQALLLGVICFLVLWASSGKR